MLSYSYLMARIMLQSRLRWLNTLRQEYRKVTLHHKPQFFQNNTHSFQVFNFSHLTNFGHSQLNLFYLLLWLRKLSSMITHSFSNKFFELKSFDASLHAPFRPWHIRRPPCRLSLWLPPPWVADTFRNLTTITVQLHKLSDQQSYQLLLSNSTCCLTLV